MEFIHENGRIYLQDDSGRLLAEVTFPQDADGNCTIDHTFVDPSLRHQGMAGKLMDAAYKDIKASGGKAAPICTYAIKWFGDHPEKNDIL